MSKRIDDIEILRAVAIVYVLIEHTQINLLHWNSPAIERFYAWFGGWTGVDLFFVISGFVITRELEPRLRGASDRIDFLRRSIGFWLRRCWRLLPSAWLWLGIGLIACVVFNQSGAFAPFRTNFAGALASALQVQNLHMAYIFGDGRIPNNFLYWSLSLEEQFYLVLPFIVLLSGKFLRHTLVIIALWQVLTPRFMPIDFMLRADGLALGALLALWQQTPSWKLFEPRFLVDNRLLRFAVPGVLLAALATMGAKGMPHFEYRVGVIAVISALLVLIAAHDRNLLLPAGALKKIALWFGARSYALYLIHIPVFAITREIWFRISPPGTEFGPDFTVRYLASAAVLLVLLAELNYRVVEMPLRRKGKQIANDFETGAPSNAHARTASA